MVGTAPVTVTSDRTRRAILTKLDRYQRSGMAINVWCAGSPVAYQRRINHLNEQLVILVDKHSDWSPSCSTM